MFRNTGFFHTAVCTWCNHLLLCKLSSNTFSDLVILYIILPSVWNAKLQWSKALLCKGKEAGETIFLLPQDCQAIISRKKRWKDEGHLQNCVSYIKWKWKKVGAQQPHSHKQHQPECRKTVIFTISSSDLTHRQSWGLEGKHILHPVYILFIKVLHSLRPCTVLMWNAKKGNLQKRI